MASPTAGDAPHAAQAPAPLADATDAALAAAAAVPDPDGEFGFQRAELLKEKLIGTVGFDERHVFLCYKSSDRWPSHLEAAESDRLPRLLAAAIEARKPNMKKNIKLTICEGEDGTESSNGDVLIFPDMIRYKLLTHFDVDNFVEEVLVKDIAWLPGSPDSMSGSYVFVCSHGSRDKRSGICGPPLIKRFKTEIHGLGLDGQVSVSACSHVGGHKYTGSVIIFSSHANGEVTGHWYGYVVPDDVPVLLHKHIRKVVGHLWRGQMGLSKEQQKQAPKLRSMIICGKESLEETGTDGASFNLAAAKLMCQGNGGFACRQTDVPKEKQDKRITVKQNPKSSGKENDMEGGAGSKKRRTTKACLRADQCPVRDMEFRRPLMENYSSPNELGSSRHGAPGNWRVLSTPRGEREVARNRDSHTPCWHDKQKPFRVPSFPARDMEWRSPLIKNYSSPNELGSSHHGVTSKWRGLSTHWGEQEVARNKGSHTPYWLNKQKSFRHDHSHLATHNGSKQHRETANAYDARCKSFYWPDKKYARELQNKESRWAPHMLYASKTVYSSPRLNDEKYDKSADMKSPYYCPYSD